MERAGHISARKLGSSLTELLVVIVILAILAAILYPVYSRSILHSKAKLAPHNLRQIWMSTKLYQEDMGGETGAYDSWTGENLPPLPDGTELIRKFASDDKQSTCGRHRGVSPGDPSIEYENNHDQADKYLRNLKGRTIAFVDPNCNDGSVGIKSLDKVKRAIGINLDGQIFDRTNSWQYWQPTFWGLDWRKTDN